VCHGGCVVEGLLREGTHSVGIHKVHVDVWSFDERCIGMLMEEDGDVEDSRMMWEIYIFKVAEVAVRYMYPRSKMRIDHFEQWSANVNNKLLKGSFRGREQGLANSKLFWKSVNV
jgi:hypothetical protein